MPRKNHLHITHKEDNWRIVREGSRKASSVHETKNAAINHAVKIAKKERGEVIIHNKDGKISDKDSYGKDPFPPRDKKH